MSRTTVFISYSHKDERWKNRLIKHLGVLSKQDLLRVWDDRRIQAGQDWYQEIQDSMEEAGVAILLISANSLTSDFILREEVQRLLERRDKEGMPIFPIVVAPCDWEAVPWLRKMQLRPLDGRPLSRGRNHQIDSDLTEIAKEIRSLVASSIDGARVQHQLPQNTANDPHAPSVGVATGTATVEITINREFDSYTSDEQNKLLSVIATMLEIAGDVRVVAKRRGSVKLSLELTSGQAERLLWAVKAGDLAEFGVVNAEIVNPGSATTDDKSDDRTRGSSMASTVVTETAVISPQPTAPKSTGHTKSRVRFIGSRELHRDLPKVLESLETPGSRYVLTVQSKPKAVLIGAEAFLALLRGHTPEDRLLAMQLGALIEGLENRIEEADVDRLDADQAAQTGGLQIRD